MLRGSAVASVSYGVIRYSGTNPGGRFRSNVFSRLRLRLAIFRLPLSLSQQWGLKVNQLLAEHTSVDIGKRLDGIWGYGSQPLIMKGNWLRDRSDRCS